MRRDLCLNVSLALKIYAGCHTHLQPILPLIAPQYLVGVYSHFEESAMTFDEV